MGDRPFVQSLRAASIERYVHCCDLVPRVPLESLSRESLIGFLRRFSDGLRDGELAAPHLWQLAEKLDPSAFLHAQTARWLGQTPPEYHHPGRLMYLPSTGEMTVEPEEATVLDDQRRGRAAYQQALLGRLPDTELVRGIWRSTRQAVAKLPRGDWADARRELADMVGELAESNPFKLVLIRDFADHAPCHYVRAALKLARQTANPEKRG